METRFTGGECFNGLHSAETSPVPGERCHTRFGCVVCYQQRFSAFMTAAGKSTAANLAAWQPGVTAL